MPNLIYLEGTMCTSRVVRYHILGGFVLTIQFGGGAERHSSMLCLTALNRP
jgi:hypothetical protein